MLELVEEDWLEDVLELVLLDWLEEETVDELLD